MDGRPLYHVTLPQRLPKTGEKATAPSLIGCQRFTEALSGVTLELTVWAGAIRPIIITGTICQRPSSFGMQLRNAEESIMLIIIELSVDRVRYIRGIAG
jgi:hypothetical protein